MRYLWILILMLGVACGGAPDGPDGAGDVPTNAPEMRESGPPQLSGTRWELFELNGTAVVPGGGREGPYLVLNEADSSIWGHGGCNGFFGMFTHSETGDLHFDDLASTLMACPDMDVEERLMRALQEVDGYRLDDRVLSLLRDGQVAARWKAGGDGR